MFVDCLNRNKQLLASAHGNSAQIENGERKGMIIITKNDEFVHLPIFKIDWAPNGKTFKEQLVAE